MKEEPDIVKELRQQDKLLKIEEGSDRPSHYLKKSVNLTTDSPSNMQIFIDDESQASRRNEYGLIDRTLMGDERNKTLFDWSPEAIVIINKQGILLDANRKLYEWLGYKPAEVIGKDILELPFLPKETKKIVRKNFILRMRGEDVPPYEVEFLHKNEMQKWGEIHGAQLKDDINNVTLDLVMVSDITERKKTLDKLKESEEKFRNIFENANDLIQCVDAEGKFIEVNPKWLETLEYTKEEVKYLTLNDILREDQIPHCMELFKKVCNGENVKNVETVFISKTGKEIFVEGNANGQFKEGRFISTIGIFRDISERTKM